MLQYEAQKFEEGYIFEVRWTCELVCATLLEDGRFAFLMNKESEDLRNVIDRTKRLKIDGDLHVCATLLEDGRFAFLMNKESEDLRNVIDRTKRLKIDGDHCGPFSRKRSLRIMYQVARGVEWMHNHNIIHRDLKASNALVSKCEEVWDNYVADYECSVGVIGIGFWRAPEILQACKDGSLNKRLDLFTKEADAYSYGMMCYEILTRRKNKP